ncbi:hypothetical protein [Spirosoma rigui]|uniref:hypothetical protein n=1 Tax=Spirosoma rigui TaxID=564064 RepID=UPI0009B18E39|nr:hypothetical protein [Spirosoma rigui]
MNIWRLISFHEEHLKSQITSNFIAAGRIAIGWGHIGSLDAFDSKERIGKEIRTVYPNSKNSNIGGPSLWHMYANIQIGDLIIIDAQKNWDKVVEVTSDYEWSNAQPNIAGFPDYFHQRSIKPRPDIDASQLLKIVGTRPAPGQSPQLVLFHYGAFSQALMTLRP